MDQHDPGKMTCRCQHDKASHFKNDQGEYEGCLVRYCDCLKYYRLALVKK